MVLVAVCHRLPHSLPCASAFIVLKRGPGAGVTVVGLAVSLV